MGGDSSREGYEKGFALMTAARAETCEPAPARASWRQDSTLVSGPRPARGFGTCREVCYGGPVALRGRDWLAYVRAHALGLECRWRCRDLAGECRGFGAILEPPVRRGAQRPRRLLSAARQRLRCVRRAARVGVERALQRQDRGPV